MKVLTNSRKGKASFVSIRDNSIDVSVRYVYHDVN